MNEDVLNQSSKEKVQNKDKLKDIFLEPTYGIKGEPIGDDRNHKSFMGGLSYVTRHWLILIMSIITFCSMAALFFKGDQLLSHALQQARTVSYFSNFIYKIESEIVALNSDSNNFIWTKDIRYAENYNKRAETLIRELKILAENPEFPTSKKLSTTVYDGIVEHKKQFLKIIKMQKLIGFDNTVGILANANTSLATIENRVSQSTSARKNIKIKDLVHKIKIIEIKLAQGIINKKQKEIIILINLLSQAVLNAELQSKERKILEKLIQSHSNDITQLSRSYIIYNKAKIRLGEISAYIAPSINTIMNFNDNLKLLTRQENRETHELIQKIILLGTSVILLLFIISQMIISRSVSTPSTRIAETAMELAHGNVSAPIPYLANSDSIGQLSNTLVIFRENMLQADRLRKDLEIARQEDIQPSLEYAPNLHNTETHHSEGSLSTKHREEIMINSEPAINQNTISNISNKITTTSQNASNAFEEVERTEIMVSGLKDTAEKVEDIEILMIGISDQISLLAVQTALNTTNNTNEENLVHLDETRDRKKSRIKSGSGQSVDDRIKSIQDGTKKVIKDVQEIRHKVNDVNQVAREISNSISREALEAANQLLRQSEDLRTLLDNILDKTQNENPSISTPDI